jgi:hypothetical protein
VTPSDSNNGTGTRSNDAAAFALHWLTGSADTTVHTIPVVAVVDELLTVLRDEQIPDPEAYQALRRAVRLLGVFAAEPTATQRHRADDTAHGRDSRPYLYDEQVVASSGAARRFAKETLRGPLHRAIRSEPVIEVVKELRHQLLFNAQPSAAHTALRRAVRLLNAYIVDDEYRQRPAA